MRVCRMNQTGDERRIAKRDRALGPGSIGQVGSRRTISMMRLAPSRSELSGVLRRCSRPELRDVLEGTRRLQFFSVARSMRRSGENSGRVEGIREAGDLVGGWADHEGLDARVRGVPAGRRAGRSRPPSLRADSRHPSRPWRPAYKADASLPEELATAAASSVLPTKSTQLRPRQKRHLRVARATRQPQPTAGRRRKCGKRLVPGRSRRRNEAEEGEAGSRGSRPWPAAGASLDDLGWPRVHESVDIEDRDPDGPEDGRDEVRLKVSGVDVAAVPQHEGEKQGGGEDRVVAPTRTSRRRRGSRCGS